MSIEAWFKPPLTLFIVWGGFVFCFLLCGSSRRRLCRNFCFCQCEEAHADYDEVTYEHLSSRRRQELNNLRSMAILRRLVRFTLTLKEENLMKCVPHSELNTPLEEDQQCSIVSVNDIEMGAANATVANDEEKECEAVLVETPDEESKYTHVLVTHPGYDIDGLHVKEWDECSGNEEKKRPSPRRKLFSRKSVVEVECEDTKWDTEEGKELSEDGDDPNEPDEARTEKRAAPIFCAVCLMEYEVSERVCWASNHECTHVFHEDCIVQWLISLGKKRSKRQSFPRHPTEKRLLDYDLACPCCRQAFISKRLVQSPPEEEKEEA